ncbi:MAG: DUF1926 domain-containing protein [Candidatus Omnitrophica bacterium]|nr:DUF1926 domain-containing protein [Candidatus Omnitrophota bacterium]
MAARKIHFIIGVHSHQPVGNFNSVFEKAFADAYKPFWEIVERHSGIKISAHFSGCLLDWLKESRPEFLEKLRQLAKRGQVEMISGGYYEPILPLLSEEDASGQIKLMNIFCENFSGIAPRGLWLTERVWEPHLASLLAESGISYTILDDTHFELTGFNAEDLDGYYVTENEGKRLFIFPGSERLRYLIPFKMPEDALNYLRRRYEEGQNCAVLSDDGEKFGVWPETRKWVYDKGWLEKFFTMLEENGDWIEIVTFSEYLDRFPPNGMAYLPCASYREMLEWSGGFFRNFLARYPESNHMHKRMLNVSRLLENAARKGVNIEAARIELYRAQCNCAYWHGIFGGLYLHHLRHAVYEHLLKAETAARENVIKVLEEDMDYDGYPELYVSTPYFNLYLDPEDRGMLAELDYIPKYLNVTNTLTRRPEAYHKKILPDASKGRIESIHDLRRVKEEGLEKYINYDSYRKASLLDHFLPEDASFDDFAGGRLNLPESHYKSRIVKGENALKILLTREGIKAPEIETPFVLNKTIMVNSGSPAIGVDYHIENSLSRRPKIRFGVEFNLSLHSPSFQEMAQAKEDVKWILDDDWFGIRIQFTFSQPVMMWHFPIMTVSGSEGGLEKTYQGISLLFHKFLKSDEDALNLNMLFSEGP